MSSNISLVLTGLSPVKTFVDPPAVDELSLILLTIVVPEGLYISWFLTLNFFKYTPPPWGVKVVGKSSITHHLEPGNTVSPSAFKGYKSWVVCKLDKLFNKFFFHLLLYFL